MEVWWSHHLVRWPGPLSFSTAKVKESQDLLKTKLTKVPCIDRAAICSLVDSWLGMGNTHAIGYVANLIFDKPCAGGSLYFLQTLKALWNWQCQKIGDFFVKFFVLFPVESTTQVHSPLSSLATDLPTSTSSTILRTHFRTSVPFQPH